MTQTHVFVWYNRHDEPEKAQLVTHLEVLQQVGLIDVWSEDKLGPGVAWQAEIEDKVQAADIAILLITPHLLASAFTVQTLTPLLRQRHQKQQLILLPLIAKACHWQALAWLAKITVRPQDGQAIWGSGQQQVDQQLSAIAAEVAHWAESFAAQPPLEGGPTHINHKTPVAHPSAAEPNPLLKLPPQGFEWFAANHKALLQQLYAGCEQLLVAQEIGGGWGGARVLLVQPFQNKPLARQIVKISQGPELQREYDNYYERVEADLPLMAAKVSKLMTVGGLSGLIYSFVGGRGLGQTQTLEAYYQTVSAAAFKQTLKILLQEALGQAWYTHTKPYPCFFEETYGRHLAEHVRLKLRPDCADGLSDCADGLSDFADGLWPLNQAPARLDIYQPLSCQFIQANYRQILSGTWVRLEGFRVTKVKADELKLEPLNPQNAGVVIKVEFAPHHQTALSFALGDQVVVRGEVLYNRQSRMEDVVQRAFADFQETSVAVQQKTLAWGANNNYPNPLQLYPQILGQPLSGKKSWVHGDLHLRNVLVDAGGRPWLIDFARVTERHNLYDFIKLETFIRQMILGQPNPQFSFDEYLHFEEALVAMSLAPTEQRPRPLQSPDLQKAYDIITALRQIAAYYIGQPDFQTKYFPALFLYNVAVLKYYENHGAKATRLAFIAAAVVGRVLTQDKAVNPNVIPFLDPNSDVSPKPDPAPLQPSLPPDEIAFQQEMLAKHQKNLRRLLLQKSNYGAGTEPLRLLNQIEAEEETIEAIKQRLGLA